MASYMLTVAGSMLPGLKYTLGLFFITVALSIPAGLLLAFLKNGRVKPVRWLISGYVFVMRGTPLMLQLFFFYFGLTFIRMGGYFISLGRFQAACVAFVLNYAAYFCEIFRGGILSVDGGQYEAAKVLGFTKFQTSVKIVVPQMVRVCLPPVSNECITLVKDTALVISIGVTDILALAKGAVNRDVSAAPFLVAGIFYLVMTFALTKLFQHLERRFAY